MDVSAASGLPFISEEEEVLKVEFMLQDVDFEGFKAMVEVVCNNGGIVGDILQGKTCAMSLCWCIQPGIIVRK